MNPALHMHPGTHPAEAQSEDVDIFGYSHVFWHNGDAPQAEKTSDWPQLFEKKNLFRKFKENNS